jgi:hypothetical protein
MAQVSHRFVPPPVAVETSLIAGIVLDLASPGDRGRLTVAELCIQLGGLVEREAIFKILFLLEVASRTVAAELVPIQLFQLPPRHPKPPPFNHSRKTQRTTSTK